jgi:PhoPQ-activated pathogenicity-related protein
LGLLLGIFAAGTIPRASAAPPAVPSPLQKAVTTLTRPPAPQPSRETAPLDAFIAKPEPAFRWNEISRSPAGSGPVSLEYVSQTWQGLEWKHRARIYRPRAVQYPGAALVLLMGFTTPFDALFGQLGAEAVGAPCIVINDIPNQPIGGLIEDDLLAQSLETMLDTGDASRSLIFPMTKSAIKGMDAIQQWSKTEPTGEIQKFILIAPSKRGWATWLAAAEDKRVAGFVPIGYNNLRVDRQIPNQLKEWGEFSTFLKEYTERGLVQKMMTDKGKRIMAQTDPYSFRNRLPMPKLLIDSTNNGYWTLDALDLYWDKSLAPADLLYVANAGHYMDEELPKVFGSIAAWSRRILANDPVTPKTPPTTVHIWFATAKSRDFRTEHWDAQDWPLDKPLPRVLSQDKEKPVSAYYVEREYPGKPQPLRLTSKITILDARKEKAGKDVLWVDTADVNENNP